MAVFSVVEVMFSRRLDTADANVIVYLEQLYIHLQQTLSEQHELKLNNTRCIKASIASLFRNGKSQKKEKILERMAIVLINSPCVLQSGIEINPV